MNTFMDAVKKELQTTTTENGAFAYNTTGSNLLDFFSTAGAMRSRTEWDIANKFEKAFQEFPELAVRMLFYTGDVRGGLGERRTFRTCLRWLAFHYPDLVLANLENIPHYNRWDSIFDVITVFEDAKNSSVSVIWDYLRNMIARDLENMNEGKNVSLLAKWMPSINTSSAATRKLAQLCIKRMGVRSESHYRKMLALLRKYLKVTERLMSDRDWDEINYEAVPSYAMKNYAKAFFKHDSERFSRYKTALQVGKAKINAGVLYPYDIVHECQQSSADLTICNEQWKALPNYVDGKNNILVMADVSGSMCGRPIEASVGLAIYFAERNHGAFANTYMTFTDVPHFVMIDRDENIAYKVNKVMCSNIGYSTNLAAAFAKILDTAVKNKVPKEEMPKALVVISDMEIDPYFRNNSRLDFVGQMKKNFEAKGYDFPKLVLWNVESRHDTTLTQNKDVLFFSGLSASTFKDLLASLDGNAYAAMIKTLMNERYDAVKMV